MTCLDIVNANRQLPVSPNSQEGVSRAARRWTTTAEESCTTGTMRDEKGLNWEPGGVRSGAGVRKSGASQESSGSSEIEEAAFSRLCRRR